MVPHPVPCRDRLCASHPQLTFLGPLLDWLAEQNSTAGGFAEGRLDLDRVAVAGHSRGGKLATLHFASAGLGFAQNPTLPSTRLGWR